MGRIKRQELSQDERQEILDFISNSFGKNAETYRSFMASKLSRVHQREDYEAFKQLESADYKSRLRRSLSLYDLGNFEISFNFLFDYLTNPKVNKRIQEVFELSFSEYGLPFTESVAMNFIVLFDHVLTRNEYKSSTSKLFHYAFDLTSIEGASYNHYVCSIDSALLASNIFIDLKNDSASYRAFFTDIREIARIIDILKEKERTDVLDRVRDVILQKKSSYPLISLHKRKMIREAEDAAMELAPDKVVSFVYSKSRVHTLMDYPYIKDSERKSYALILRKESELYDVLFEELVLKALGDETDKEKARKAAATLLLPKNRIDAISSSDDKVFASISLTKKRGYAILYEFAINPDIAQLEGAQLDFYRNIMSERIR